MKNSGGWGMLVLAIMAVAGITGINKWLVEERTTLPSSAYETKKRYIDLVFPELNISEDLTYSKISGNNLKLDLFQPKGDSLNKRPAIVWIHSGGFATGDKKDIGKLATLFAQKGYVTASINYRLEADGSSVYDKPEPSRMGEMPAIVHAQEDAETAVKWLKNNAGTYRIDTEKVYVGGSSAGAVTALLVGFNLKDPMARVAGVVSIMGVADPAMVHSGAPPVIMFNGGKDALILPKWVLPFQKKIEKEAVVHEFNFYPEANHGQAPYNETVDKITFFLAKLVGGETIQTPITTPVSGTGPSDLSPTPTLKLVKLPVEIVGKEPIVRYFEARPKVVCNWIRSYFSTAKIEPSRFSDSQLAALTKKYPELMQIVSQTGTNAKGIGEAYLQTCVGQN